MALRPDLFTLRLGTQNHNRFPDQMLCKYEQFQDGPPLIILGGVPRAGLTVLELKVHPTDLGKVIGRQGRTAKSIRTILGAAGMKMKKRLTLEILEQLRTDLAFCYASFTVT